MTLAELQTARDDLLRAIFSGSRVVQKGDRRHEYQSTEEMRAALDLLDAQIGEAQPSTARDRISLASFSRD